MNKEKKIVFLYRSKSNNKLFVINNLKSEKYVVIENIVDIINKYQHKNVDI